MKRKLFALMMVLCLALMAVPALATDLNCLPYVPMGGSSDVKYYQEQNAAAAVGVTSSCVSENAVFHSEKEVCSIDATAFGSVDKVGACGVLGVGTINATATTTNTSTCGSYNLHQQTTQLNNAAEMNQLGGIAACSTGYAGAGGNITQTQTISTFGVAALPGGFATTSYCGTQTASAGAH